MEQASKFLTSVILFNLGFPGNTVNNTQPKQYKTKEVQEWSRNVTLSDDLLVSCDFVTSFQVFLRSAQPGLLSTERDHVQYFMTSSLYIAKFSMKPKSLLLSSYHAEYFRVSLLPRKLCRITYGQAFYYHKIQFKCIYRQNPP